MKIINITIIILIGLFSAITFHQYINYTYYYPYRSAYTNFPNFTYTSNYNNEYVIFDYKNSNPNSIICGKIDKFKCSKYIKSFLTENLFANKSYYIDHRIMIGLVPNNKQNGYFEILFLLNAIYSICITAYLIIITYFKPEKYGKYNMIISYLYLILIIALYCVMCFNIYNIMSLTNNGFNGGARVYGIDLSFNKITNDTVCENNIDCFSKIDKILQYPQVEWIIIYDIMSYSMHIDILPFVFPFINLVTFIFIIYSHHNKSYRRCDYDTIQ